MNRRVGKRIRAGVIVLCAAGAPSALPACASERPTSMAPASDVPEAFYVYVDDSFSLSEELDVDVLLWLGGPLEAHAEPGQARVVLAIATYTVKHLWTEKSVFYGPIQAGSAEPIDLGTAGVNIGLAKWMAAQILGESEAHPYVRELTRRCDVSVKLRAGKTWGEVASTDDLDISAAMRE